MSIEGLPAEPAGQQDQVLTVMTVEITQADIDAGKAKNAQACAIALACRRVMPGAWVEETRIYESAYDWDCDWYPLPEKARNFVERFDAGLPVTPFTFTTELHRETA